MSRIARMLRPDESTVYHVISRTALPGFPLGDADKDHLVFLLHKLSKLFFVDVLGFCMMGNHVHLALRVHPESSADDAQIRERLEADRGEGAFITSLDIETARKRLCSLSEFMRSFKQCFGRYFNKKHNRKGYFWGDRYKSVIVEEGRTLINLLAYIDLNPIRAGIVKRPEDYRWSGLGYLIQNGNRENLISLEMGVPEWNDGKPADVIRLYRRFVYETGAVDTGKGKSMDPAIVKQEKAKDFLLTRTELFAQRCRYFTDSGIIGSKEFVANAFRGVRHLLKSKDTRRFTPVGGIEGTYSMKKLATG
jgi:REP element-mobilizing transposase RayT